MHFAQLAKLPPALVSLHWQAHLVEASQPSGPCVSHENSPCHCSAAERCRAVFERRNSWYIAFCILLMPQHTTQTTLGGK